MAAADDPCAEVTEHRTESGLAYSRSDPLHPVASPVALIHGWCCDRTVLAAQFDFLARSRTVVSLDLSGHGASATLGPPRATIGGFAEDVMSVLQDAEVPRAGVIGHSMGGLVALAVAAAGRATNAVLLDPAPLLSITGKRFFAEAASDIGRDVGGAWRLAFINALYRGRQGSARTRIETLMTSTPTGVAMAGAQAMADYDAERALRAIQAPIHVISAGHGERLDPAMELCPNLTVTTWPGHDHFFPLEDPDRVNRAVLELLDC